MKMTHTNRGFAKIEVTDTRGCICRVQRSSAACVDAVWIFCDDPNGAYQDGKPSPHLDADQAREVARALLAFADNADYEEDNMSTLAEQLPKEQARCRTLLAEYRAIGPAGAFGAAMIEHALQRADQAVLGGGVAAMIRAYEELRTIE